MARTKVTEPFKPHRIALVDDHWVILDGLSLILSRAGGLEVCFTAGSAREAMQLLNNDKPDVMVVDLALPDRSGLELVRDLLACCPDMKIICLSALDELRYAKMALNAGAKGFVHKSDGAKVLVEAIQAVCKGGIHVSEKVNRELLKNIVGRPKDKKICEAPLENLTPREYEVMNLISRGFTTQQISERLHISPNTVQRHKENVKTKWNVQSAEELIRRSIELFDDWLKA